VTAMLMLCSFKCTNDYHAPTDCVTIKKWLTKCIDDSETANFISANTKDVSRQFLICLITLQAISNNRDPMSLIFFNFVAHVVVVVVSKVQRGH
jgi:hypothetical protein